MKKTIMWMGVFVALSFAVPGVVLRAMPSGEKDPPLKISELHWLVGVWRTDAPDGFTEEHWSTPVGGSMLGMCRIGEIAEKTVYEILLIEEKDGRLCYSMKHFTAGLVDREDKALVFDVRRGKTDRSVIFDGSAQEKPTVITYQLESKDKLVCVLERTRAGKELRTEFHMTRVQDAARS